MKNEISLKIHSRAGTLFSGMVSSLSAINDKGRFDIMPMHSNFISLIQGVVHYRDAISQKEHDVPIDQAILRSSGNTVDIYLGLSKSS
jgi:F0F1-type ATP synthase epsilon subunit